MSEVEVIGPLSDGLYHLGYYAKGANKFYSFNVFVSRDLAQAMADKINRDSHYGYPVA